MRIPYVMAALFLSPVPMAMAADSGFVISPRVGTGLIHIDPGVTLNGESEEVHAGGAGVTLGYVTSIGLLVEGGYSSHGNWDFFGAADEYKFSEYMGAIGYQFETPRGFRLIPKVGRTHWELYTKEGAFRHPGPELERTLDGSDYFWEFTLQKKVTDSVALGVTYKKNHFDFGSLRSVTFTMSFAL